jgi:hypothetical protein
MVEMAGVRRHKEMPTTMLPAKRVEAFGSASRIA